MLVSAFTFYRGAAGIMAADLAPSPVSGIRVQACGDAHLSNFGGFAAPDRRLVFDINDFDETLPGPWEWDLKRLAASLEIGGRDRGFGKKVRKQMVIDSVAQYRKSMHEFAGMSNLDVWYARTGLPDIADRWGTEGSGKEWKRAEKNVAKAKGKDRLRAFSKLTHVVDGELKIIHDPPSVVPFEEIFPADKLPGLDDRIRGILSDYRETLSLDRRQLLDNYRYVHAAMKVVGVGSVGTRAWMVLMIGRDMGDPLFLQIKEAQESVLEPSQGASEFSNHGQRVVEGQRWTQSASDIFLGWVSARGIDDVTRDYYVRQLWDWKGSARVEQMDPRTMAFYGQICGSVLARAHARTGDRFRDRRIPGQEFEVRSRDRSICPRLRRSERTGLQSPARGGRLGADHGCALGQVAGGCGPAGETSPDGHRPSGQRAAAAAALVLMLAAALLTFDLVVRQFPWGLLLLAVVALAPALAWYGFISVGPPRALALWVAALLLLAAIFVIFKLGEGGSQALVVVAILIAALDLARRAARIRAPLEDAPAPNRPVLFFNPKSGGGKVGQFSVDSEARSRGIEPIELTRDADLEQLVREAADGGADALAMAGGDGSQAVVAAVAAEMNLPYACIPAGTRNHFALDLGVDRDDVVGALDAFVDGGERRVDLAEVNGRVFVNNVSLGLYAEAVQREGYREAKLRTIFETVPEVIGPDGEGLDLRWQGPGGHEHSSSTAILVSNNRYRLGRAVGSGTRPRIDDGVLGITVASSLVGGGDSGRLPRRPWHEWSVPEFEVRADRTVPAGIDGEAVQIDPPLRFRIRPGALRVRIARRHPGASPSAAIPESAVEGILALLRTAAGRYPRAKTGGPGTDHARSGSTHGGGGPVGLRDRRFGDFDREEFVGDQHQAGFPTRADLGEFVPAADPGDSDLARLQ